MQNIDSYFTIFSTHVPFLLFQDPIWEPTLYLVFLSPESPHVCDSHSVLLCFPCPWLCWWMWTCSFVEYPLVWVFSRSLWSCVLLQRMLKAIFLPFHSEPCPNTVNCFEVLFPPWMLTRRPAAGSARDDADHGLESAGWVGGGLMGPQERTTGPCSSLDSRV